MKKRMRLSPQNKLKLSVRFRLIALASVFFLATIILVLYFVFDGKKKIIAEDIQNITDRFGFYRSIEAVDFIANTESDLYQVPINVMLEHTDFKSKNFGGRLFDPTARDLIFVRYGSKIPLKSQIEDYDAVRGFVHATVWIDTLKKNEKPFFDVYYSLTESHTNLAPATDNNLLISMNEGLSGNKGTERVTANAAGSFKADGLLGNGRGFSNERGDYVLYKLSTKNDHVNGFTLSAWIYPELKNLNQIICGYNDLAGTELHIGVNNQNAIFIKLNNKGEEIFLNGIEHTLNINQWSHVALTNDIKNKTIALFIDGNEILSTKIIQNLGYPTALFFGRSRQNAADGFTGIIDQIELLAELKSQTWSKFAYNNAMHPISQWTYGSSNAPKINSIVRETTRQAIKKDEGKSQQANEIKFQTQKQRASSKESTATVSSSATLMQQKLQQIQQKVRKEELAKN